MRFCRLVSFSFLFFIQTSPSSNLIHKIITQLCFFKPQTRNPKSCPPSSSLDNNNPSNFNASHSCAYQPNLPSPTPFVMRTWIYCSRKGEASRGRIFFFGRALMMSLRSGGFLDGGLFVCEFWGWRRAGAWREMGVGGYNNIHALFLLRSWYCTVPPHAPPPAPPPPPPPPPQPPPPPNHHQQQLPLPSPPCYPILPSSSLFR